MQFHCDDQPTCQRRVDTQNTCNMLFGTVQPHQGQLKVLLSDLDDYRNEKFSLTEIKYRVDALVNAVAMRSCWEGLVISPADVEQIAAARAYTQAAVEFCYSMIETQAVTRRRNLDRFRSIKVISLGEDCFSRLFANRWGFKPNARLGEKSFPFDLAVHPILAVAHLLDVDFEGYMDVKNLKWVEESGCCADPSMKIVFNHEKGPEYAANDFRLLKEVYSRRINALRTDLKSSDRMLFLFHISYPEHRTPKQLALLVAAVDRWAAGKQHLIICLNTWKHGTEFSWPSSHDDFPSHVQIVNTCYPYANYQWQKEKDAFSQAGFLFESELCDKISHILDSWLNTLGEDLAQLSPPRP